jgi:hypothetical protein
LSASDRYSSIGRLQAVEIFGMPKVRTPFATIYFPGLHEAGAPEE